MVPNREEVGRILEEAKERGIPRDYVVFATCCNSGLRISEVIHLKTTDLINGKLKVTRRKKRVLQPSTIDISTSLWALLTDWAQMFDGYLFPGNAAPCIITRTKKGEPQPPEQACGGGHAHIRTLQRRWELTVARTGLSMRGRGIHQTRHYFATEMYSATRDIRATQVALAHSSVSMTERYAHVVDLREKINLVKPTL